MIKFKLIYMQRGAHTHVRFFAAKDRAHQGFCGNLSLRNEEWDALKSRFESDPDVTIVDDDVGELRR